MLNSEKEFNPGTEITVLDQIYPAPKDLVINFMERRFKEEILDAGAKSLYLFLCMKDGEFHRYAIRTKPIDKWEEDVDFMGYKILGYFFHTIAGYLETTPIGNNGSHHYLVTSSPDYEPRIKSVVTQLLTMLEKISDEPLFHEDTLDKKSKKMVWDYTHQDLTLDWAPDIETFINNFNESNKTNITLFQFQRKILKKAANMGLIEKSNPEKNTGRWVWIGNDIPD